jgi:hypothetical protein
MLEVQVFLDIYLYPSVGCAKLALARIRKTGAYPPKINQWKKQHGLVGWHCVGGNPWGVGKIAEEIRN